MPIFDYSYSTGSGGVFVEALEYKGIKGCVLVGDGGGGTMIGFPPSPSPSPPLIANIALLLSFSLTFSVKVN